MDILDLVTTALASLNLPCIYGWYDQSLNATHITFLEFMQDEGEYLDDNASQIEHYIQVDIWTKDAREAQQLKTNVKRLLKNNGLGFEDSQDLYETETQIWHIATRWLYAENLD